MKTIYFDCFAGASGDMLLGAMLDLGLSLDALKEHLGKLDLAGYDITLEPVVKCGVTAKQFRVKTHPAQSGGGAHHIGSPATHGRSLKTIERIIGEAQIPPRPRERALKAFRRLGAVEAGVHGVPVESVHFHEIGAIDSIVDITGYFLALELMDIERVVSSPLPPGKGFVQTAHGRMPVPAPATAKLLEGIPVADNGMEGEILTPTGVLLLSESAEAFQAMPSMTVTAVGHGAGEKEQSIPNIVRAFWGEGGTVPLAASQPDTISILETNIDDMSAEIFPHVIEGLMSRGALDAFVIPTIGKKGRPASLLTALCPTEKHDALILYLFQETTTLGVRHRISARTTAERDWIDVKLPWGQVRVKRARYQGRAVNLAPEFEDCRNLAESADVPLKEVLNAAAACARRILTGEQEKP
ncbi:MAG: nickel pincer cofactor biosynthesis protein LarC [Nitrospinota bacterium]